MLIAALVGGLIGAGVMLASYFIGVALTGAALGAVAANLLFTATGQDPHFLVLVLLTVLGAAAAMYLQRYFIIVGTAFGGAWTLIVGAMAALIGDRRRWRGGGRDVWVAYPLNPAPGQRLGEAGVDCARIDWHNCAARLDRRRAGPGGSTKEEILKYD